MYQQNDKRAQILMIKSSFSLLRQVKLSSVEAKGDITLKNKNTVSNVDYFRGAQNTLTSVCT